jgi:hypothetical protein
MFNIILIVKDGYYENFESILQTIIERNLHYDKIIIYFAKVNDKNRINNNILYSINKHKINIFDNKNKDLKYVMNEIAHTYNGICTYILVDKLDEDSNLIHNIIDSIQNCLNHGIYIKSSKIIPFHKEAISNYLLEKTFYNQYEELFKKGYYDVSIISFNYQHIWIKKLFFELKYICLLEDTKEDINNDFNYLINLLYNKYVNMYAKSLL